MDRPTKRSASSDLIPGIVAAVAFLVIGGLFGASHIWLSTLLAVAVYFGVRWITPSAQPEDPLPVTARERLERVRVLMGQVGGDDVRNRLRVICEKADALLGFLEAHPDKGGDSLFMMQQYLDLTQTGVRLYLESAGRSFRLAGESRQKLNELLDSVMKRFTALYERLIEADDAALAGELQVLNQTLQELDSVCSTLGSSLGGNHS